jgi:hypothetical protein
MAVFHRTPVVHRYRTHVFCNSDAMLQIAPIREFRRFVAPVSRLPDQSSALHEIRRNTNALNETPPQRGLATRLALPGTSLVILNCAMQIFNNSKSILKASAEVVLTICIALFS